MNLAQTLVAIINLLPESKEKNALKAQVAEVKFSQLPSVPSSQSTDIFALAVGGTSYQETRAHMQADISANTQLPSTAKVTGLDTALAGKLDLAGGTLTGDLILNADPSVALGAATKQYVDNTVSAGDNFQTIYDNSSPASFKVSNLGFSIQSPSGGLLLDIVGADGINYGLGLYAQSGIFLSNANTGSFSLFVGDSITNYVNSDVGVNSPNFTFTAQSKIPSNTFATAGNYQFGFSDESSSPSGFFQLNLTDSGSTSTPIYVSGAVSGFPTRVDLRAQTRIGLFSSTASTNSKVLVSGSNASGTDAPGASFFTVADSYPVMQLMPFSHGVSQINFDCYSAGGTYRSSSATSNFQMGLSGTQFQFNYRTGIAQGTGFGFGQAGYFDLSNGGLVLLNSLKLSSLTASSLVATDTTSTLTAIPYSSSNTASALVLRDGSGNFSAGTIVAGRLGIGTSSFDFSDSNFQITNNSVGGAAAVIRTSLSGSANQAALYICRGDQTNGNSLLRFVTGQAGAGATDWDVGTFNSGVATNTSLVFRSGASNLLTLTNAGVMNLAQLTASRAVVTNSSKDLVSLPYDSANTNSALVQRDGSGNFSAGTITASGLNLSGLTQGSILFSGASTVSQNNTNLFWDDTNSRLYVGGNTSTTLDVRGKINVRGVANSTSNSTDMLFYNTADSHPLLHVLPWQHDGQYIGFDAYWNGTNWISSYSGSNYLIEKNSGAFSIQYAAASQGSNISWSTGINLNTNGNFYIGADGSTTLDAVGRVVVRGTAQNTTTGSGAVFYNTADSHPLLQVLPWNHNDIHIGLDAYWNGTNWISSYSSSSFRILKLNGVFEIDYASAAQGAVITWATGISVNASTGSVFVNKLALKTGANGYRGSVTLSGASTTVNTTAAVTGCYIGISNTAPAGVAPAGSYTISISNGNSFTILNGVNDGSTVQWFIMF